MGTGVLDTSTPVAGLTGHHIVINTDKNRASRLSVFSKCSVCTADTNEWLWATFKVIKTWSASGCFSPLNSYSTNTHTSKALPLFKLIWKTHTKGIHKLQSKRIKLLSLSKSSQIHWESKWWLWSATARVTGLDTEIQGINYKQINKCKVRT